MNLAEMILFVFVIGIVYVLMIFIFALYLVGKSKNSANSKVKENDPLETLSKERIEEIHSRGKITKAEKIREYQSLGLCAPGDAIGSAGWRCDKFKNCEKCLIDYLGDKEEFTPMFQNLKPVNIR